MDLRNQLQNLSMEELAKIHKILGLDEEYPSSCYYPSSGYGCKGDYIMHIFEKDDKEILKALKQLSKKE